MTLKTPPILTSKQCGIGKFLPKPTNLHLGKNSINYVGLANNNTINYDSHNSKKQELSYSTIRVYTLGIHQLQEFHLGSCRKNLLKFMVQPSHLVFSRVPQPSTSFPLHTLHLYQANARVKTVDPLAVICLLP